jgi:hypothetical protein
MEMNEVHEAHKRISRPLGEVFLQRQKKEGKHAMYNFKIKKIKKKNSQILKIIHVD